MNKKIDIISGESGEWQGLYVDGELAYQNHSISWEDFVKVLEIPVGGFVVNDEWLENSVGLPRLLSSIPEEAKE